MRNSYKNIARLRLQSSVIFSWEGSNLDTVNYLSPFIYIHMLWNCSIFYILLHSKNGNFRFSYSSPSLLFYHSMYAFWWCLSVLFFPHQSFLFIQSWTKISRQIYSGMDIILKKTLFAAKDPAGFTNSCLPLYHIFTVPIQAVFCCKHTSTIAWKIQCPKMWPH